MKKLQELLEDDYEDFESLENVEKSSYVLDSELWESKFDGLLALVKEYIVDVWEIRKQIIWYIVTQDLACNFIYTQSSPGERSGKFNQNGKFGQNGKFSQNGKLGQNGMSGQKGKVHLGPNVSSSAHYRGCVVNGSGAMAAIWVLLLLYCITREVSMYVNSLEDFVVDSGGLGAHGNGGQRFEEGSHLCFTYLIN